MKKTLILILVLALCLGLCACGEATVVEKEVIPEKYQDLFNALEAEDYDAAQTILDGMKPEPEAPAIIEVEITMENFLDYYEIIHGEDIFTKDAYGNISEIYVKSDEVIYSLKDGYNIADGRSSVSVGYSADYLPYDLVSVDFTTGKYQFSDTPDMGKPLDWYGVQPHVSMTVEGNYLIDLQLQSGIGICETGNTTSQGSLPITKDDFEKASFYAYIRPENLEIMRVEGVLYLYADQS